MHVIINDMTIFHILHEVNKWNMYSWNLFFFKPNELYMKQYVEWSASLSWI